MNRENIIKILKKYNFDNDTSEITHSLDFYGYTWN